VLKQLNNNSTTRSVSPLSKAAPDPAKSSIPAGEYSLKRNAEIQRQERLQD